MAFTWESFRGRDRTHVGLFELVIVPVAGGYRVLFAEIARPGVIPTLPAAKTEAVRFAYTSLTYALKAVAVDGMPPPAPDPAPPRPKLTLEERAARALARQREARKLIIPYVNMPKEMRPERTGDYARDGLRKFVFPRCKCGHASNFHGRSSTRHKDTHCYGTMTYTTPIGRSKRVPCNCQSFKRTEHAEHEGEDA